jgi:carbonic anhydrase
VAKGAFVTAVNCMDGRVQLPVNEWLRRCYSADYVDTVTEPGPVRVLSEAGSGVQAASVRTRVAVSVEKHGSRLVAVAAHQDCAGNPEPKERQLEQLRAARQTVEAWGMDVAVVLLWVGEDWQVTLVD